VNVKLSLLTELKRRNVLRAAALYAAGAWLLVAFSRNGQFQQQRRHGSARIPKDGFGQHD
jgi:hypothetical protein